jgi:uncharacterized YccA/Bax inhibitor family protein
MASNPVFNKINSQIDKGEFAGFRAPRRGSQQVPPQQGYPGQGQSYGQPPMGGAQGQQMSPEQLQDLYNQQSADRVQMGRLTLDDVVMKTLGLFSIVVVFAAAGWILTDSTPELAMPVFIGGIALTLILGIVIAMKKTISVPLIVTYAVAEGIFVGAISNFYNDNFNAPGQSNLVATAVIATMCVFVGMFAGWKFGIIRVTEKSRRIFGLALMGYLLFAIVNVIASFMGVGDGWGFGGSGLLGIGISIFAVGLASYSLAIDFDTIQRAVNAEVPEKYSWLLAHGLIVSLVWLYLEILRLLARMRD